MIRPATEQDIDEICRVFGDARASMPYLPRLHSAQELWSYFHAQVRGHQCWVSVRDERVVGFVVFGGGWLLHLYVAPAEQGHGIGAALLSIALKASEAGLQLWTFQANARARRFYERHGFASVEYTDGSGNQERVADVRYALTRGSPAAKEP